MLNKKYMTRFDSKIPIPLITSREKETLILIANELTTREIAEKLYVSHETIKTHRSNLLLKLQCKNTAGLVKKGIILGIIEL